MKIMLVDTCIDCPYCLRDETPMAYEEEYLCTGEEPGSREETRRYRRKVIGDWQAAFHKIPEWCPLEEKEEKL